MVTLSFINFVEFIIHNNIYMIFMCIGLLQIKLVGFGIESKVMIKDNIEGSFIPFKCENPELCQLNLLLISKDSEGGEVLNTATTDKFGKYKFDRVTPGNYIIEVEPKDGFSFESNTINCEIKLGTDKDCNNQLLLINGFAIKGKAMSYEEPLEGVTIQLFNKANQELASVLTNANGEYR